MELDLPDKHRVDLIKKSKSIKRQVKTMII